MGGLLAILGSILFTVGVMSFWLYWRQWSGFVVLIGSIALILAVICFWWSWQY